MHLVKKAGFQRQLEKSPAGGSDQNACGAHVEEFIVKRPAGSGTAEWERVTAADRITAYTARGLAQRQWGDPDYVENVYRKASF